MFKRKLLALGYHASDTFELNDEIKRRQLIVWLEDQTIRHYRIEDRASLRAIDSPAWIDAFRQYLNDLACPYDWTDTAYVLDWLLSFALRLELDDNGGELFVRTEDGQTTSQQQPADAGKENGDASAPQFENPLDSLNFESDDFKRGTAELADFLKVPLHPNHLITLRAICKLVQRSSADARDQQQRAEKQVKLAKVAPMNLNELNLGFTTGDKVLDKAMKVMRLLYINDLKGLQMAVNSTIVKTQSVTANPKTDSALGQTGRG